MIHDCFLFFNELDLLEIRLNVLNKYVDKFVIIEATRTHSGLEKPLYYLQNKNRYKLFWDKIIHIVVDTFPSKFNTRWELENYHRNGATEYIQQCSDDDIILLCDVDEIINPECLKNVIRRIQKKPHSIVYFAEKRYIFYQMYYWK